MERIYKNIVKSEDLIGSLFYADFGGGVWSVNALKKKNWLQWRRK